MIADLAAVRVSGKGLDGYLEAVDSLAEVLGPVNERLAALRACSASAASTRSCCRRRGRHPLSLGLSRRRRDPAGEPRARLDLRRLALLESEISDEVARASRWCAAKAAPPCSPTRSPPGRPPTAATRRRAAWGSRATSVAYAGYRRLRRLFGGRLVNVRRPRERVRQVKDAASCGCCARRRRSATPRSKRSSPRVCGDGPSRAGLGRRAGRARSRRRSRRFRHDRRDRRPRRAAARHSRATHGRRRRPVVVDMGARLDGYHSDITRDVRGRPPAAEQRAVYDVVLEAQLAGCRPCAAAPPAARSTPPLAR